MPDPAPGDRIVAVKAEATDEWFGFDPDAVATPIDPTALHGLGIIVALSRNNYTP